jgi:acetyltransferase-like isoleucine patch superfamily enzyme
MQFIKKIMAVCVGWANEYNHGQTRKRFNFPNSVAFCHVSFEGNVTIGDHTYVNDYSRIDTGSTSKIVIGKHCAIGRFVHITSKTHDLIQPTTDIERPTLVTKELDVIIGNCVWIGDKVTILPGVTIGDYAVIGAHALVTGNVKPFEIVGGIPAKHIRFNTEHEKYRA